MATMEKFCLRWNDFESNISGAFKELREDKDFFDVTLACADDQIQAHKVILSACSPFFRSILRRNRHEHPLLYLKDVKFADLVSVLNFMYHGEVNVAQEELNSFLAVVEDLKVKGLTQNNTEKSTNSSKDRIDLPPKKHNREHPAPAPVPSHVPIPTKRSYPPAPPPAQDSKATPPAPYLQDDDDIQEVVPVKTEPLTAPSDAPTPYTAMVEQTYPQPTQQQQEGMLAENSMEEYGVEEYNDYAEYEGMEADYSTTAPQAQDGHKDFGSAISSILSHDPTTRVWQCLECGMTNKDKARVRRHAEVHFKDFVHCCPHCNMQKKSSTALRLHIHLFHRENK